MRNNLYMVSRVDRISSDFLNEHPRGFNGRIFSSYYHPFGWYAQGTMDGRHSNIHFNTHGSLFVRTDERRDLDRELRHNYYIYHEFIKIDTRCITGAMDDILVVGTCENRDMNTHIYVVKNSDEPKLLYLCRNTQPGRSINIRLLENDSFFRSYASTLRYVDEWEFNICKKCRSKLNAGA